MSDLKQDALELEAAAAVILARHQNKLWPEDIATLNATRTLASVLIMSADKR